MLKIIFLILSIQIATSEEDQLCLEKKNEKCFQCVEYAKIQKDKCECQSGYFNFTQGNTTQCYQCSPYCKKCNSQGLNDCEECYNGKKEDCRCGTDQVFVGQLQKCVSENEKIKEMQILYKDFNSCNSTSKLSNEKLKNIFIKQSFEFTRLSDYAYVLKVQPKNINITKNLKNKELHFFNFTFDSYQFNGTMVNGQNNQEIFLIFEIYNQQNENQYLLALICDDIENFNKTQEQQILLEYFHLFHNPPQNCNSSTYVNPTTLNCTNCINGFTLVNNTCIYQFENFYKQQTNNCTIQNCQTCVNSTCDKCLPGFNLEQSNKCELQNQIIMQTNEKFLELVDNINLVCKKDEKCIDCFNDFEINTENLDIKNCKCKEGYFFDSQQMKCQQCDKTKCKTCVDMKTKCISCQEKQYIYNNQCFDCDRDCEVCRKKNECVTCKIGYNLDSLKKCYKCPDNCKECDGQDCILAMPGYYVDKKKVHECNKTMNCATCEKSTECLTCQESYYLEESKCYKCDKGCRRCSKEGDNLICNKCQEEYYYLVELEGKCVPCIDGCKSCQNDFQVCEACDNGIELIDGICQCDEGKYFDSETKKCQKLMKECLAQKQKDKCETCTENHFLNDDKQCEECTLNKCVKCKQNDECDECEKGYYQNKGHQCEQCISGCQSCESKGKCDECEQGYYQNEKKQCEQCGLGCSSCESKGKCDQCNDGYFLNEKKQCEKCIDGCKKCKSKEKCEKCDDDYQQTKKGLCKIFKCKANCKICSEDDGCESCIDGYNFNTVEKICSCPENCKTCALDKNDTEICKVCNDGYYVSDGKCKKCSNNCLKCDDTKCIECQSDFILFEGSCFENHCQKKFYDVKTQQCTKCEAKYYLDQNKQCQKCTEIQNCLECTEKDQCQKCDNEFYLKDKKLCVKCEENCLNCDATKCIKCQSGYDIIKTQCVKQTNSTLFIGLLFLIALFYGIYNYREQIQQLCINQNRIELNQENENDNGDVELQTNKNRPKTKVKTEDNFNILDDN